MDKPQDKKSADLQGEGNYEAAKEYREDAEKFVEENRDTIEASAREAARALDGPEGKALREAEAKGREPSRD